MDYTDISNAITEETSVLKLRNMLLDTLDNAKDGKGLKENLLRDYYTEY